jgi:hypothetical protein
MYTQGRGPVVFEHACTVVRALSQNEKTCLMKRLVSTMVED